MPAQGLARVVVTVVVVTVVIIIIIIIASLAVGIIAMVHVVSAFTGAPWNLGQSVPGNEKNGKRASEQRKRG